MRYLLLAISFLFVSTSLFSERTVLGGKLKTTESKELLLVEDNLYDYGFDGKAIQQFKLDAEGNFKFVFDLKEFTVFSVNSPQSPILTNMYFFPGDSMYLDMSIQKLGYKMNFEYDITGKGKGVEANMSLSAYNKKFTVDDGFSQKFQNSIKNDTLNKFFGLVESRRDEQMNFLDSLKQSGNLNDFSRKLLHNIIVYDLAYAKTSRYVFNYKKDRNVISKDNFVKSLLSEVKLENPEFHYLFNYRNFIMAMLMMNFVDWFEPLKAKGKIPEAFETSLKLVQLANTKFKGVARDVALSKAFLEIFKGIKSKEQLDKITKLLKNFTNSAFDKGYPKDVSRLLKTSIGLIEGMPAPDFSLEDINGKTVSLSDFKGKVVYIDFWGTWCGPCRKEIPHLKKLHDKFHSNKNIIFMSVGLERGTKENWKKFVEKEGLKGVQLFVSKKQNPDISAKYKIRSVPTFMIIDKDGNLKNPSASRPSNPEMEKILLKVLAGN